MPCPDAKPAPDAWLSTVQALCAAGVPLVVIGSWALQLHGRLPAGYLVPDADLVLPAQQQALHAAARVLQTLGWQLWLWQQPLTAVPPLEQVLDAFYLRARREGQVIDLTFAGLQPDYPALAAQASLIQGIPVASLAQVLQLKRQRASERDRQLLQLVGED